MNMRKITSMTLLVSLIVVVVNSVVLYIVPEGRVAHWANWIFLGLTKEEWGAQHLTVGTLFLIAGLLHIYYNWSAITAYMKNKARELKIFTPSLLIAVLLTLIVVIGTYFNIPPMSTLVEFSDAIKADGAVKYGTPPYGHAELSSLKGFAQKEQLDLEKSITLLQAAGVQVESANESLKAIAAKNELSPQQVYEIIKAAKIKEAVSPAGVSAVTASGGGVLPEEPEAGFGKKTLAQVCTELGLEPVVIVARLKKMGITAEPEMIIRKIAAGGGKEPLDIYQAIRTIAGGENSSAK